MSECKGITIEIEICGLPSAWMRLKKTLTEMGQEKLFELSQGRLTEKSILLRSGKAFSECGTLQRELKTSLSANMSFAHSKYETSIYYIRVT